LGLRFGEKKDIVKKGFEALSAIIMEFSKYDDRIRSAIRSVKEKRMPLASQYPL